MLENNNYMEHYEAIVTIWVNLFFIGLYNEDPLFMLQNSLKDDVIKNPDELINIINEIRFVPGTDEHTISVLNSFEDYVRISANIRYMGIKPKDFCFVSFNEYGHLLARFIIFGVYNYPDPLQLFNRILGLNLKDNKIILKEATRSALNYLLAEEEDGRDNDEEFGILLNFFNSI